MFRTSPPLQALRDRVRAGAQNRPGTYRMIAATGVVLYVGKSKRLRTRLMGYFRAREEQKAWRIMREAAALEWEYTPSEFASLLRELELIKRYRPPYNVHRKRDGLHAYLKISGGPAPRLQVVGRVNDEPGTYFGPLRGNERIVAAVKELNDILLLRDCSRSTPIEYAGQEDLFGVEKSPLCPRYELGRCMAPCAARCTQSEYRERVEQARAFLANEGNEPLRLLESRMANASARLDFEHAASIRDRIGRLEMLREEFRRFRETVEGLSFLYAVPGVDGDHRIYAIRAGWVRGVYAAPRTAGERRVLIESVEKHYDQPEAPADATSRRRIDEMLLLSHWFRTHPGEMELTYARGKWARLPLVKQLESLLVA